MRIGVIGAGQLGQMLGSAARELGAECIYIDPSPAPPAAAVGTVRRAAFDDPAALEALAEACDVVTYEFENVPVEALLTISGRVPVYPPPDSLRRAQDRLAEKQLFDRLEIPLPAYRAADSVAELDAAAASIGLPLVVKTRRMGYDGKGQAVLRKGDSIDAVVESLGPRGLITEQWIAFDYEVSSIGARNVEGDIVMYPLTENRHAGGILWQSRAPIDDSRLTDLATRYVRDLLEHLDYVGVMAVEFFVVGSELLVNEFAPRVHNSGHWTIEGTTASQFTNHLLAIANRPLRTPEVRGHAGMVNLIGEMPAPQGPPCGRLHNYGKAPRPGRKLGHITVVADSAPTRDRELAEIADYVTESTRLQGPGS